MKKNGKYCNGKKSMNMKPLAVLLALTLLVGCAIGGTIAWLTAQSQKVINTFAVGDINIDLAETTEGYKIIPGGEDEKDPTITVEKGSEKCYVYALVENNIVLETGKLVGTLDIDTADWTAIGTNGPRTLYRYNKIVDAQNAAQKLPVFTKVFYSETITKEQLAAWVNGGPTVVVQAYAHQSANIGDDSTVADKAAIAWAGVTAIS